MYSVGKMFTYYARSSRFCSKYTLNQHSVLKELQERRVQVQDQQKKGKKMLKLERQLQGFRALAAIAEDPGLILSNYMVIHNHL